MLSYFIARFAIAYSNVFTRLVKLNYGNISRFYFEYLHLQIRNLAPKNSYFVSEKQALIL